MLGCPPCGDRGIPQGSALFHSSWISLGWPLVIPPLCNPRVSQKILGVLGHLHHPGRGDPAWDVLSPVPWEKWLFPSSTSLLARLKGYSMTSGCLSPQIFQGEAEVTPGSRDWEALQCWQSCGTPHGPVTFPAAVEIPFFLSPGAPHHLELDMPGSGILPCHSHPSVPVGHEAPRHQQLGRAFQSTLPPLKPAISFPYIFIFHVPCSASAFQPLPAPLGIC